VPLPWFAGGACVTAVVVVMSTENKQLQVFENTGSPPPFEMDLSGNGARAPYMTNDPKG
jgi:hypothetical protein